MSQHRGSGKAAVGLLAVAAAGVGVAVAVGAGYSVAHATLSDTSAYVAKGTAVEHVNGESRRVDATTRVPLAKRGEKLKTIALPGGRSVAINQSTGVLTPIDGGTMSPSGTVHPAKPKVDVPMNVVVSGSTDWVVDHDGSDVRILAGGRPQHPIHLDRAPADAVPGPSGSLFVLIDDDTLLRVGPDAKVSHVDVSAGDLHGAGLTVADGHPYLVNDAGAILEIDTGEPQNIGTIHGFGADAATGRMTVGSLQSNNADVLVVSSDLLGVVDPNTGEPRTFLLHDAGSALGRPVEFRDHVYVPDITKHQVLVVDLAHRTLGKPLTVPGDRDGQFDLFVAGGRLWANDQYAQHLLEIDSSGTHDIDKGSGDGTRGDTKHAPAKPTPAPGSTPPPNVTPPSNPSLPGTGGTGGGHGHRPGHPVHHPPAPTPKPRPRPAPPAPTVKPVAVPSFAANTNYHDLCDRIEQAGLTCEPVSAGEDHDGNTEDVLSTNPTGGTPVPPGSTVEVSYIGPSQVPQIEAGSAVADTCARIETAQLRCVPTASPDPARDPSQYGTVASLEPASATPLAKGQPVKVVYYASFVMPDLNGKPGDQTCQSLAQSTLALPTGQTTQIKCAAAQANPAPKNNPGAAGTVYQQQPAAGATYNPGAPGAQPLHLTTYSGNAQLDNLVGKNADQALQACSQYFTCSISPNTVPPVDPQGGAQVAWVNTVQAMQDPSGQPRQSGSYPVGSTQVVLIKYGNTNQVPDVSTHLDQTPQQACDAMNHAGFPCTAVQNNAATRFSNVNAQSLPAGSPQPVGTPVQVAYNPAMPTHLVEYQKDPTYYDGNKHPGDQRKVHILAFDGDPVPAGFNPTPVASLGFAYRPNTPPANAVGVKEFQNDCDGIQGNILYSSGAPDGCMSQKPALGVAIDVVGAPDGQTCPNQMIWIWRVTNGHGYEVVIRSASKADVPPVQANGGYAEPMGCVWPA